MHLCCLNRMKPLSGVDEIILVENKQKIYSITVALWPSLSENTFSNQQGQRRDS